MKKLVFGLVLGVTLSLGINVNAAENNARFAKMYDSQVGGVIQTLNKDLIINTEMGEASGTDDNIGGTLTLYNGKDNKRVVAGTSKINDHGIINLYDKNNNPRISFEADDKHYGPIIYLCNPDRIAPTYLSTTEGYINYEKIITMDYLKDNYISKNDIQKLIDDALKSIK